MIQINFAPIILREYNTTLISNIDFTQIHVTKLHNYLCSKGFNSDSVIKIQKQNHYFF